MQMYMIIDICWNKCHHPDFLGFRNRAMVFERFMGGELFVVICHV